MNCSFCGAAFQVGVACCPFCGSPTAYAAQRPGQAAPQYIPGAPQPPMQQSLNGLPAQAIGGHQQYQQISQSQNSYSSSGFAYNNQQTMQPPSQGSGTQNMFPPIQQSGKRQATQATNGYNPASQLPSKLSDYKPASTPQQAGLSGNRLAPTTTQNSIPGYKSAQISNTMPGLKLSHYGQPSRQPGKLSDYKPAPTQPGKLSDYKPAPTPELNSLASYNTFASIPGATPGSFSSIPGATPISLPSMPNVSYSTLSPSAALNSFGTQSTYTNVPNMANTSHMTNPSFSAPPVTYGSLPQTGAPPSFFAPPAAYNSPTQTGAPPMYVAAPTQKKKAGGLLVGSVAVILLAICIGAASIFLTQTANTGMNIAQATKIATTPVPTVALIQGPSGNTSVPTVSALFSTPQMATEIDDHDKAKQVTSSFSSGQIIYVSFMLNSKNQKGYVQAKWYKGKQLYKEVDFSHDPSRPNGYFSMIYDAPTTDGSVELYWSTTANFSDAKLARVAHFTVTAAK